MLYTRRHYEDIAKLLATLPLPRGRTAVIAKFASHFAEDNPAFNAKKFVSACIQERQAAYAMAAAMCDLQDRQPESPE